MQPPVMEGKGLWVGFEDVVGFDGGVSWGVASCVDLGGAFVVGSCAVGVAMSEFRGIGLWSISIGLELVVLCSGDAQVLRRLRDDVMVGVNGMGDGSARPDVVW